MCTVIVEVPGHPGAPVRLLAVRDEDPARPWDPPGNWWPDSHPGVTGVRDRRAGGAWLASDPVRGQLAVLLNRMPDEHAVEPSGGYATRGSLALGAVAGDSVPDHPLTAAFNLVSVASGTAATNDTETGATLLALQTPAVTVTSWDGVLLHRQRLAPGMHMLAHHDVNDIARTPRIAAWLPEFESLRGIDGDWREQWIALLAATTRIPVGDDRAILRDNRAHGYPTQSLLACVAEIGSDSVRLDTAVFDEAASSEHPVTLRFERSL